jgi:hypothetical protein
MGRLPSNFPLKLQKHQRNAQCKWVFRNGGSNPPLSPIDFNSLHCSELFHFEPEQTASIQNRIPNNSPDVAQCFASFDFGFLPGQPVRLLPGKTDRWAVLAGSRILFH